MRATTVVSLLLALVLAGLATFTAQIWLNTERAQILSEVLPASEEEQEPQQKIVVARTVLQFGQRLTRDKLQEIDWAAKDLPNGAFTSIDQLVSDSEEHARFVVSSMEVGEPVFASKITEPGQRAKLSTALTPGMKAISIRVNDVLGVAGFVLPGDRVDIMLTRSQGSGSYVDVLLQGVKVLAIDQIADDRKDKPSVVRTVTFEVSTEEAQKLALAANVGTMSLALRNIGSSETETLQRVTTLDLVDPQVAEELRLQKEKAAAEEAALAAAEMLETGPTDTELMRQEVETLLKGFMSDISGRLNEVETSIDQANTVDSEPVRTVVASSPPPKPLKANVGVIRAGKRSNYLVPRVDPAAPTTAE
ncbi:Flp pilus assembly protein CpaB [Aliiroseovarius crassostreae]|uniref:Flp pilus assembly protein CpaB n=1 Tax=Aliiroseovarius crassostreae TaxID=154981 RepID=A0A9Q9LY32_9RHOB|nr:Flp pilus assembly protein CpaB [Aliiroseovarius crassostreae]UWP87848.1 Flp pilus assembly protein CpaB [Aliiroseovarius crassostreae]UWP91001.1 Flp pilus assembly protein CpaB [Aliiroseovarius crassostreae]UWP94189.1 Flp pilus assembly protein CpaB [Aliiroseovarius crassostreae]UWP97313.1 Flp pilus assembly protein CpaB [Aliiroseovarius crassostreae]UWQ00468.1 Flp pilus assembly protein CpaB [Aliiroseovarius crassostreae]